MMAIERKKLPSGIPEENEYHSIHWTVIATYLIAVSALYLLLTGA